MDLDANAARFSGFADLYDEVRPSPPGTVADMLKAYARTKRPNLVVDLGSGSGLSSRWCAEWASEVIGIEPSDDMRARAISVTSTPNVSFVNGWSHSTGLPDGCADVVVAVQALHWMDPVPTFREVARLLRRGGVFAALDCDWPPSVGDLSAEDEWERCRSTISAHETRLMGGASPIVADAVRRWSKDGHLSRMQDSGAFRWCRESAAHSAESGDYQRFVDLLRSQGDLQTLLKAGLDEDELGVSVLREHVRNELGPATRPFWFTWRTRIGVI